MRRVVIALGGGLVFYSLSDILLWQRIFEAHKLFQFDGQYQTGHVVVLVGLIGIGMVLLIDAGLWPLWYALAFYTLARSGLADVLYYWLDRRPIPATLPWLEQNRLILFKPVTQTTLLLSTGAWLMFWLATLVLIRLMCDSATRRLAALCLGFAREVVGRVQFRLNLPRKYGPGK